MFPLFYGLSAWKKNWLYWISDCSIGRGHCGVSLCRTDNFFSLFRFSLKTKCSCRLWVAGSCTGTSAVDQEVWRRVHLTAKTHRLYCVELTVFRAWRSTYHVRPSTGSTCTDQALDTVTSTTALRYQHHQKAYSAVVLISPCVTANTLLAFCV